LAVCMKPRRISPPRSTFGCSAQLSGFFFGCSHHFACIRAMPAIKAIRAGLSSRLHIFSGVPTRAYSRAGCRSSRSMQKLGRSRHGACMAR